MRLSDVARVSREVAERPGRGEKTRTLAALLEAAAPAQAPVLVAWLSGELPQGRIGLGPAALRDAWPEGAAAEPRLTVAEVDAAFTGMAELSGPGSSAERVGRLRALLAAATTEEQDFLARLVFGELRQGAVEGLVADAVAKAAGVPAAAVRRALMLTGDLGATASAALGEGEAGLARLGLRLFRPVQPMLAQAAGDVEDAVGRLGEAGLEWKLDGARVQVHRVGDDVRVYSRRLNEVTESVPELVEAVRALPAGELVLDGEAIALRADRSPLPFQDTMRRFGRKLEVAALRAQLPLTPFFFDLLHVDGESLLDRPAHARFTAREELVPQGLRVPRLVTGGVAEATAFLAAARGAGHEGLVAKDLSAPYEAGRRGGGWLKVKQTDTLDLVVLAAEWGNGRRNGWLSNLHLGARDPGAGAFVMLGKTFKGLTDALLEWQTGELLAREIGREGRTVHVRPELVVEIAFEGVQTSPRYPAGLALRFARVKRYRTDKTAEEADTIERVRQIHARGR